MLSSPFKRNDVVALAVGGLLFWLIRFCYLGRVPIWDAAEYYLNCVAKLAEPGLDFAGLNCSGHPSAAYILPFALLEKIFPGRVELINLLNGLMAFSAIALFVASAHRLREGGLAWEDRLVLGALLAVSPFVQANTLHFNTDIGVFFFFSLFWFALLKGAVGLTAGAALGLVFTKETGVLLLLLTAGYWIWRRPPPPAEKKRLLVAVGSATGVFLLFALAKVFGGSGFVWTENSGAHVAPAGNLVGNALQFFDGTSLAYFHSIFTINFNWLLCALILAAVVHKRKRDTVAVATFCLLLALVLTRYKTYNNTRYFLTLYPLILIAFTFAVRDLIAGPRLRAGVSVVAGALLLASCFRTVDPVAKLVYGTFRFGQHRLLAMTSFTGECCGFGRDQLVYNLEFVHLGRLQDRIFERLKPTSQSVIAQHEILNWRNNVPLDPTTFHRSLRREAVVGPQYLSPQKVYVEWPASFTYVLFPIIPERADRDEYAPLLEKYVIVDEGKVEEKGYELSYVNFKRKE